MFLHSLEAFDIDAKQNCVLDGLDSKLSHQIYLLSINSIKYLMNTDSAFFGTCNEIYFTELVAVVDLDVDDVVAEWESEACIPL